MELRISLSGEAPDAAVLDRFAGVAMIRGEMILRHRGEHWTMPAAAGAVERYLVAVCERFAPRPVWYRLADLWSDEAATLAGAGDIEIGENPVIGIRGTERMMRDLAVRDIELGMLSAVAARFPCLHILAPFIHDAAEFEEFAREMRARKWPNRLGSMIEVPAAVIEAAAIVEAGASNLFVGLNDLTSLTLGRDRGTPELKLHPAMWRSIAQVAEAAWGCAEWGVGGSLTRALVDRAEASGANYAALHYAELPALLDIPPERLPDLDFVRTVKLLTRERKAMLRNN